MLDFRGCDIHVYKHNIHSSNCHNFILSLYLLLDTLRNFGERWECNRANDRHYSTFTKVCTENRFWNNDAPTSRRWSTERGERRVSTKSENGFSNTGHRLEGFLWKSEDWHGRIISLQVSSFIVLSSRCMEEIENCFMFTMCLTSHVITNTNVITGFM